MLLQPVTRSKLEHVKNLKERSKDELSVLVTGPLKEGKVLREQKEIGLVEQIVLLVCENQYSRIPDQN